MASHESIINVSSCHRPCPAPTAYTDFLATKRLADQPTGVAVPIGMLPDVLYDWQAILVQWALNRGRAALFASTGLGKSLMQLSWAALVPGRVLIIAPLAVTHQTIREADSKLSLDVRYVRTKEEMGEGISITNYDRIDAFLGVDVAGIVLDESSALKSITSQRRALLINRFTHIPFRLCCTATPAPNDIAEISQHAEFLGVMTRTGVLSTFFVHDDQGWRLRGHAKEAFFRWMASWAMALRMPDDLGYDGRAFVLPPLTIVPHFLSTPWRREGELFPDAGLKGISDRAQVRGQTAMIRAQYAAEIVRNTPGPILVWTGLNAESAHVTRALNGELVCEIVGSDSIESKEAGLLGFLNGTSRILVSKPSICGHGLNLQHAHTAVYCGLSDSWESWFQSVRRLWRYGQREPVTIHVVLSEHEKPIWDNIQRKERDALVLMDGLIAAVRAYQEEVLAEICEASDTTYGTQPMRLPHWLA